MSYAKLRGGSGIQWPCTEEQPEVTERLYSDGQFWATPEYCESYGRDLVTGAPLEPTEYRAMNPDGKAVIKAAGSCRRTRCPATSSRCTSSPAPIFKTAAARVRRVGPTAGGGQ